MSTQVDLQVFKVRSRDDGRLYAVKRCWERFRGARDRLWDTHTQRVRADMRLLLPSCRQQKLAEVEKHETLANHPNCVVFVNAWEERGLLYIQTELCRMRCVSPSLSPSLSQH